MERIPVEARVAIEQLAPIADWFVQEGMGIRSQSDLIHMCVEMLYKVLLSNEEITPSNGYSDALLRLNQMGLFTGRGGKRNQRKYKALSVDVQRESNNEQEINDLARIAKERMKEMGYEDDGDDRQRREDTLKEARRSAVPDPEALGRV